MDLEIIDYDVEGAAYRDGDGEGPIVDAAFVIAKVRRRAADAGVVSLRIPIAPLDGPTKTRLLAAFGEIEAVVRAVAEVHFEAEAASPKALDAKIAAAAKATQDAELAKREHAEARAAKDALDAEIAAARAKFDDELAEKREELEALKARIAGKGAAPP